MIARQLCEAVSDWQNRALEPVYPIVFLDALRVKIRDAESRQVKNKAVYVALGVTPEGEREVLGLWVAATNRVQTAQNVILKRQLRARLKQIEKHLNEIDKTISKTFSEDSELSRRRDILCSIPGIGTVTAIAILINMPELGSLDGKQAASLAGLAPMTR